MGDSTWRERSLQFDTEFLNTANDVLYILRNEMETIIGESDLNCIEDKIREVTYKAETAIFGVAADPI